MVFRGEDVDSFASGEGMSSCAPQTNAKRTLVRGANDDLHKFTA